MEILTVTINGNILSVNSLNMGPRFRVVKSSRLPAKIAAYLVSIGQLLCKAFSLRMVFFKQNIPGLAAYFDNSAVYFKTFWQPWGSLWIVG